MIMYKEYELNINGKAYKIEIPQVMGILNCTPDSFYAGSRKQTEEDIATRTREIVNQGGCIVDVGAMSTRPGGTFVTVDEEKARLRAALPVVMGTLAEMKVRDEVLVSVDTYRAEVALMAVEEYGVDIINDVGAPENKELHSMEASARDEMYATVAKLGVPYILMSSKATTEETLSFFEEEVAKLKTLGAKDIILDPGYGFGKTMNQNFEHLNRQSEMVEDFGMPLLAGVSRKRMIWQTLGITADEALNGTTALNIMALERGAAILRVHDVKEAKQCIDLYLKITK